MAQLYIPAKGEIRGPWLLTADELEALDKILDTIKQKIDEAAEEKITSEAKADFDKGDYPTLYPDLETSIVRTRERYQKSPYLSDKKSRVVKLVTFDEKEVTDELIKSIIQDSNSKDLEFKSLDIDISGMGNYFKLNVTSRIDGEITYSAKCNNQSIEDSISYEINSWLEKYKPTKIQQIWMFFWAPIAWTCLVTAIYFALNIVSYQSYDYKPTYKKELDSLLEKGINKDNESKAVELYIKYSTDFLPNNFAGKQVRSIDNFNLKTSIILVVIALCACLRPKTTIGISGLKNQVKRYKFYNKLVLVIIPSSILLPSLYAFIRHLIGI